MSSTSSSMKTVRPSIDTVTLDSGLYGSTTAGETNAFTPTDFQKNLVHSSQNAITDLFTQLVDPDYDSEVFNARTNQLNKMMNQSFENNIIQPLADRGLTRGSSIQQLSAQMADSLANQNEKMMENETNRVSDVLTQAVNMYQMPYQILTGLYNLNQNQQRANTSVNNAGSIAVPMSKNDQLWQLGGTLGGAAIGHLAFGQPKLGAEVGSMIGGVLCDMRLKENIKRLETIEGINIYLFDYISGPKNQVGVMAQEVLDKIPEAVGLNESGYYYVIYPLLPTSVFQRIISLKKQLNNEGE